MRPKLVNKCLAHGGKKGGVKNEEVSFWKKTAFPRETSPSCRDNRKAGQSPHGTPSVPRSPDSLLIALRLLQLNVRTQEKMGSILTPLSFVNILPMAACALLLIIYVLYKSRRPCSCGKLRKEEKADHVPVCVTSESRPASSGPVLLQVGSLMDSSTQTANEVSDVKLMVAQVLQKKPDNHGRNVSQMENTASASLAGKPQQADCKYEFTAL